MNNRQLVEKLSALFILSLASASVLIYCVDSRAVAPFLDSGGINLWWNLTHYAILATGGGVVASGIALTEIARGTDPHSDEMLEVVAMSLIFYVFVFFISEIGEWSLGAFF